MLLVIHLILLTLILLTIKKIIKNNLAITPISGFVIGIIYFIYIPLLILFFEKTHRINAISGMKGEWTVTSLYNPEIYKAYILIMFMLISVFFILLVTPFKTRENLTIETFYKYFEENKSRIIYLYYSSILFIFVDLIFKVKKAGGIAEYFEQHWYHKNKEFFNDYGVVAVVISKFNQANLIFFTAVSLLVLVSMVRNIKMNINKVKSIISITIMISVHFIIIITHGNRIYFALFLILFFFLLVSLKLKKEYLTMLLISPILVLIFSMWAYTRSSLNNFSLAMQNYFESFLHLDNLVFNLIYDITEGINVLVALNLINHFDGTSQFYNGLSYLKIIQPILPDAITKIESFNAIVGNIYMPGTNVSINSTMLGEMYGNFGLLSFAVLIIITYCIILLSNMSKNMNMVTNLYLCLIVMWFVRSVFSDNIFLVIFVSFIYVVLSAVYNLLLAVSISQSEKRRYE